MKILAIVAIAAALVVSVVELSCVAAQRAASARRSAAPIMSTQSPEPDVPMAYEVDDGEADASPALTR